MTLDQFPPDQNRIIQALEKRIAALESQAGQVKGTPILRASGPFIIPSSSQPDPASGEIGIWSDGGTARWSDDSGGDHAMGVDVGGSVDDPEVSLFNAPGTYTPAQIQTYTDSVQNLTDSFMQLLAILRSGQLPSP